MPETEGFFTSHPYEPFFVKNSENIQGDERDVIFISVGYGRDAARPDEYAIWAVEQPKEASAD